MRENINNSLPIISPHCSIYYGLILFYWILEILVIIVKNEYHEKYFSLSNVNLQEEFINLACIVIADLLAGFCVLFTICSMKKEVKIKKKKSFDSGEIKLIHTDTEAEKKQKSLPLLISASLMHLFSISVYFLIFLMFHFIKKITPEILENHEMDWLIGFDFLFRFFFSKKYLKIEIYRHHRISLIIFSIGFVIMAVFDGISIITTKSRVVIVAIIFIFLRIFFFTWSDVLNKLLMTNDFFSFHGLMFWRGLIEFVILILLTIVGSILYFTSVIKFDFIEKDLSKRIFMKIGFILVTSIKSFLILKVIDKLTAQYVSFMVVAECFGGTLNNIFNYLLSNQSDLSKKDLLHYIFDIISIIFILLATLIYNEVITINRCGLNEGTKNALLQEEEREMEGLQNTEIGRPTERLTYDTTY